MTNRPLTFALAALAGLAATAPAGCQRNDLLPRPQATPPTQGAVPVSQLAQAVKSSKNRDFMLVVRLQFTTIQVPMGLVSDSEELWSYLDEEPLGARIGPTLAHNGIRVGLGRKQAWPEIARILQDMTGQRVSTSSLHDRPGKPIPIEIKGRQPAQTIFTFRPDGTLYGHSYGPGDNVLMITSTVNYDDLASVQLMGVPVIRSTFRRPRYVKRPEGYVFTSAPRHDVLNDLAFRLKVPAGSFVVIGPGPGIRRPTSPGYHFLVTRKKGLEFERVLVIAPEVWAVPLRKVRR